MDNAIIQLFVILASITAGEIVHQDPDDTAEEADQEEDGSEDQADPDERHWFVSLEGAFTYNYLGGSGALSAWYQDEMYDHSSPIAKNYFRLGIKENMSSVSETGIIAAAQFGLPFALEVNASWVQSFSDGTTGFVRQAGPEADYSIYLPDGPRDVEFSGDAYGGFRIRIKPIVAIGGKVSPGSLLAVLYEPVFFFQDLTIGTPGVEKDDWYFDQGQFMNLRASDWVITHDVYAGYIYSGGGWGKLAIAVGYEHWSSVYSVVSHQRLTGRVSYELSTAKAKEISFIPYLRVRAGGWIRDPVREGQFHVAGILGLRWGVI